MADFFWTSYSDNDMVGVWYLRLFWIADFGFRIGDWRGTDFAKATADSLLGAARRNKYVILPNEPTDFEVKMRIYVFGWQWVVRRRKAFFRWVRFPKRTHRRGVLRGEMMDLGTETNRELRPRRSVALHQMRNEKDEGSVIRIPKRAGVD